MHVESCKAVTSISHYNIIYTYTYTYIYIYIYTNMCIYIYIHTVGDLGPAHVISFSRRLHGASQCGAVAVG